MRNLYTKALRELEEVVSQELNPECATIEEIDAALEELPELITKLREARKMCL